MKATKIFVAAVILLLSVNAAAQDRRFLIDFGYTTYPTSTTGWNNVTNPSTGTDVTLVQSTGTSSSVHLVIVTAANNGFGGAGGGYNNEGYNGTVGDYPASACRDSHFSYTTGGTYKLTGLNTAKFYTIKIFGARAIAANDRVGTYSFNGVQKTLNGSNNTSQTITFHNLIPNAQGELILGFGVAPGSTYGYLGVMDVGETATPAVTAPSNLSADVSGTTGTLTWTDNSNNETGFVVARRLSSLSLFEVIGEVGAGVTTYSDQNLTPGVTYVYRVYAKTSTVESAFSNEDSFEVQQESTTNRRFLIDFGVSNRTTTATGWNNLTLSSNGSSINLQTNTGASSGLQLNVVIAPHNNYGGAAGTNEQGYNGQVLDYPATACIDSHFSYLAGGSYKITGLEPSRFYTLRIFGSRGVPDADRVGTYTVSQRQLSLNAANNTTQTVVFHYQKSNASGEIELDFGVAPGSQFGYMNVLDIREAITPSLAAPSNVSVSQSSTNGVVTWTDNSSNETGFRIARRLSTESLFTVVASVSSNVVTYTDPNLTTGATYVYRVYAYNATEESAYSNEYGHQVPGGTVADRRFLIDFGAPTATTSTTGWNNVTTYTVGTPIGLVASDGSTSSVAVIVVAGAQHGYGDGTPYNPQGYNGTVLDYPASACVDSHFSYQTGGTYKISGLFPNRYYSVRIFGSRAVTATDRKGTFTFNSRQQILDAANNTSNTIIFHYLKPTAAGELVLGFGVAPGSQFGYLGVMDIKEKTTPTILEPTAVQASAGGSAITVSWTDNSNNETGFKIERRISGEETLFTEVGTASANATSYTDNSVSGTRRYEYRVSSYKSDEASTYSTVATANFVSSALNPPTNLKAFVSGLTVTLTWSENNTTESGTKIERKLSGQADNSFAVIGTVGANVKEYADTHNPTNASFVYRVYAYNQSTNSPKSNVANVESVGLPSFEYMYLRDIYEFLGGNHWTGKTNWPATLDDWPPFVNGYPYATWAGVTMDGVKLTALDLSNKNLKGVVPGTISGLKDLVSLRLSHNRITAIAALNFMNLDEIDVTDNELSVFPQILVSSPALHVLKLGENNLSNLPSSLDNFVNLTELDVSGNKLKDLPVINVEGLAIDVSNNFLDFGDIEPLLAGNVATSVVYAPQKKIRDVVSINTVEGEPLEIPARPFGLNSSILWEKKQADGSWDTVNTSNQNTSQHTYLRSASVKSESGKYRWTMTNSVATQLTLRSEEIEVKVNTVVGLAVADWAFQYKYDGRKRVIAKKVPGADWTYMIYDDRDRLVFSQDGAQRQRYQWSYTTYDRLNRPVISGIYTDSVLIHRDSLESRISKTRFHETFKSEGPYGYTDSVLVANVFQGEFEPLTITYYDNYSFISLIGNSDYNYVGGLLPKQYGAANTKVLGSTTASKVRILGTTNWIWTVNHYDDRYRIVQSITTNTRDGVDRTTNVYDFTGKVLSSLTQHENGSNVIAVKKTLEYDHAGRLMTLKHKIGSGSDVIIQKNNYNEIGQLTNRKLHKPNGDVLQSISNHYNIRGWLRRINDPTDTTSTNFFSMELKYQQSSYLPQYNGNISEINWRNADNDYQTYTYKYDSMNRLWEAHYVHQKPRLNGAYNEAVDDLYVTKSGYDLNGNIYRMTRTGEVHDPNWVGRSFDVIDDINYVYSGNRLLSVTDSTQNENAFKDDLEDGHDYSYDGSGNMVRDANKGIASISYNHLNLPRRVTKDYGEYIEYSYDATGRKLTQRVYDRSGTLMKDSQYAGEFFYENDTLKFITHDEGRVVMNGSDGEYQYHLKDHLGNVRATLTTTPEVDESKATMETPTAVSEYNKFISYDNVRKINSEIFDHTFNGMTPPSGTAYSIRLTGSENERVGLRKSLSVMPGDVIKTEVWGKYYLPPENGPSTAFQILMSQILGGTAPAGTVVDGSGYYSNYRLNAPYVGGAADHSISEEGPKAYLNWAVFDKDWNLIESQSGFAHLSAAPLEDGSNVAHEKIEPEEDIVITQAGYVYIWLSNEEQYPMEVYFDDFKVEHVKSPVIQSQDYYPFGLTFNSYQRENALTNHYQYNGKEMQNSLSLGWLDYGARMYQPDLGRWGVVDLMSEKHYILSPYTYVANNPLSYIDPDGNDFSVSITKDKDGNFNISISSTIHTYGAGSNEDMAKKWTDAFAALGTKIQSGKNTVAFNINYMHHGSKEEAEEAMAKSPGDNVMHVDPNMTPKEMAADIGDPDRKDVDEYTQDLTNLGGPRSSVRSLNAIEHSTGHLLGFGDRYKMIGGAITASEPGYEKDIMGAGNGANDLNIHRQHFLDIAKFIIGSTTLKNGETRTKAYQNPGSVEPDRK